MDKMMFGLLSAIALVTVLAVTGCGNDGELRSYGVMTREDTGKIKSAETTLLDVGCFFHYERDQKGIVTVDSLSCGDPTKTELTNAIRGLGAFIASVYKANQTARDSELAAESLVMVTLAKDELRRLRGLPQS